jgi:signal transduction histidine kinase
MHTRRDRILGAVAVLLVVGIAGAVLALVLDARNRGRDALVRLQKQQMSQLTRAMDARITAIYPTLAGIFSGPYTFKSNDPGDFARIEALQKLNPKARTGIIIIDAQANIVNGTLLQKPVGTHLDRPGIAEALHSSTPTITPVGPGITTSLPTLAFVFASIDPATKITKGAFIFESDVSVESEFNQEVRTLGRGRTGEFDFIDSNGVVLASSRADRLGQKYPDSKIASRRAGFFHVSHNVAAVATVKSANWKAIFSQRQSEFEGGLGQRIQNAVLLLLIAAFLAGIVVFAMLQRRLRNAREEQRRLTEINRTSEEFISIVSHELRTPVAGVLGFLQTTLDHWDTMPDDARRNAVARAATNARRLHALTRDVLDTTSIESGNLQFDLESIDLQEHIADTVMATRDASPGREIVFDGSDGPVWVKADGIRFEQALVNLLDNALRNSPVEAPVEVRLSREGDNVIVSVLDRGPGLSPELQDRVFERFVRGRANTVQGTGLGLYIVRRIVEAHNGTVKAGARAGGGAEFTIKLPAAASPAVVA